MIGERGEMMLTGEYLRVRNKRDEERMRLWIDSGVKFCSENDIPLWVRELMVKYRPQSFHECLNDIIRMLNKQYGMQIKWCETDGIIYINQHGLKKIINFLCDHDYLPVPVCMKWAEEMDEFFERGENEHTDL